MTDLAYFIGIICADGYVSRKGNMVEVKSESFRFLSDVYAPLVKNLFNETVKIIPESNNVNAFRAHVSSKTISAFLKRCGIVSPKAYTVRMPSCINTRDDKISFVKGAIDCDGSITLRRHGSTINYPVIQIACRSQKFIEDVKDILLELGLNARLLQYKKEGIMHMVRLYGFEQARMYHNKIGFLNPKKKERLKTLLNKGAIRGARRSMEDCYLGMNRCR